MQQFPQAVESFNLALTIPNNGAVSAVQVESYKKMILVSLLASGEVSKHHRRTHAGNEDMETGNTAALSKD